MKPAPTSGPGRKAPSRRRLLGALLLSPSAGALATDRPAHAAPLFEGLDGHHQRIETSQPLAQRYFDQGMLLAHGFNPAEAARSFEAAVAIDPACASAWWALAWVLGPNINTDMAAGAAPRVQQALQQARRHAARAGPVRSALIDALGLRHPGGAALDEEAYARRLQQLAARWPGEAEVALLAAESLMNLHPYDWWQADGRAQPWTPAIEALLRRALSLRPRHPGAHHYMVHLQEMSASPARGLASADALRAAYPGSGHLLHMPSHIDMRTGRYAAAIQANRRSIEADRRYLEHVDAQGAYRVGYVAHNHHFLWAAASMAGQRDLALQAADAAWPAACGPAGRDPGLAVTAHYAALPALARVRFGRWHDLLHRTPPPDLPGPYALALWHYARATAHARLGDTDAATREGQRMHELARSPLLLPARVKNINPAPQLLRIASLTLHADLATASGRPAQAVALLREATAVEDGLQYDEPHLWLAPTRHALGAALLAAGAAAQAEAVYRQDLAHYPDNGWSLTGLAQALQARGLQAAARAARARAAQAFAGVPEPPPASRY